MCAIACPVQLPGGALHLRVGSAVSQTGENDLSTQTYIHIHSGQSPFSPPHPLPLSFFLFKKKKEKKEKVNKRRRQKDKKKKKKKKASPTVPPPPLPLPPIPTHTHTNPLFTVQEKVFMWRKWSAQLSRATSHISPWTFCGTLIVVCHWWSL